MRRTHKQIIEQKAAYVAKRAQEAAQIMAEFKSKKTGVDVEQLIAECLAITSKNTAAYEKEFDRDFGAKTRKKSANTTTVRKQTAAELAHPELESWEIIELGLQNDRSFF